MKYLVLILILTSCATIPQKHTPVKSNYVQKMERCVFQMMDKFAIKAEIALEVCEGIHKGQK